MPQYIKRELRIDTNAVRIINTLTEHHFEAYIVGGAVRDLWHHMTPKDFDIVTNATPEQIKKLFKRARIIGRRFKIVHIMTSHRDFIEVATFRNKEHNTTMLRRDNNFGTIETDAERRDFTINSMYYDIHARHIIDWHHSSNDMHNKVINVIGDAQVRFNQDPVRMLRALRFATKLGFSLSKVVQSSIVKQRDMLAEISPARLYEECLKLFHSEQAQSNYQLLQHYGIDEVLFPDTKPSEFISVALANTQERVQQNLKLSPAFIFAVLLYEPYVREFKAQLIKNKQKKKSSDKAIALTIGKQNTRVQLPKFVVNKIYNTWNMQHKLEQKNPKMRTQLLSTTDFRMAFDFLTLRAQSISPKLQSVVDFWHKAQL